MQHVTDALAKMEPRAILDETGLSQALGISVRTIPRWVSRGNLPSGTKLGGKTVWMPGQILQHIEAKLEAAAKSADRRMAAQQLAKSRLTPCFGAGSRPHVPASQ